MSHSPFVGLILFIVMAIFTLWFSSLMLRAVDILYKPSVKKWMKKNNRQKVVEMEHPSSGSKKIWPIQPYVAFWENIVL